MKDRAEIEQALDASAAGWSKGDLSTFMKVYEDDSQTAYVKSTGVVHGYGAIRDMYAARFGGKPGGMGRLSMSLLDCRPLGRDYALVTGRFNLQHPVTAGGEATGVFTLVFHKSASGWRIISDHTG